MPLSAAIDAQVSPALAVTVPEHARGRTWLPKPAPAHVNMQRIAAARRLLGDEAMSAARGNIRNRVLEESQADPTSGGQRDIKECLPPYTLFQLGYNDHGRLASRSSDINRTIIPGSTTIINEGALVGYLMGTNPVCAHRVAAIVAQHHLCLSEKRLAAYPQGPRARPCVHILPPPKDRVAQYRLGCCQLPSLPSQLKCKPNYRTNVPNQFMVTLLRVLHMPAYFVQ